MDSLLASSEICHLQTVWTQIRSDNVDLDLDPSCMTLGCYSDKNVLKQSNAEKNLQTTKIMKNYLACQKLSIPWLQDISEHLTLSFIETPFNTFANREDPDQSALGRAA